MKHDIRNLAWGALVLGFLMAPGPAAQGPSPTGLPTPSTPQVEHHGMLPGTIVLWADPLGRIPDGWRLCDGSSGTPDLTDRFVVGAPAGGVAGQVGGAHELSLGLFELPTHLHQVWTQPTGLHDHTYTDRLCSLADVWTFGFASAQVGFGPPIPWSRHTDLSGSHEHTGQAQPVGGGQLLDNRPAYRRLAFIIKDTSFAGQGVPAGAILLWSSPVEELPEGYAVCDGTAGTPDLTGRFVLSVRQRENPGETGGQHLGVLTLDELPAHGHALTTSLDGGHMHGYEDLYNPVGLATNMGGLIQAPLVQELTTIQGETWIDGSHTHPAGTDPTGGGEAYDKRPTYVEQVFVMRQGPGPLTKPVGGTIAMWSGRLGAIPTGWALCDGLEGRPDMRGRFVLGASEAGATGGSDELLLTEANLPAHDHPTTLGFVPASSHLFYDQYGIGGGVATGGLLVYSDLAQTILTENQRTTTADGLHEHGGQTDPVGAGGPMDNRPAWYQVHFLIRE